MQHEKKWINKDEQKCFVVNKKFCFTQKAVNNAVF